MSKEVVRGARRGRGAASNPAGRFEPLRVEPCDDGWGGLERETGESARPPTTVTPEPARSIVTRNDSPDVPFDLSINPYKGCEHGCIYCFARPTHAFLGLSPGLDFETRIFSKPNAAELLRRALRRPAYRPQVIALGANTDPYQPAERELGITRSILAVLAEHRHPVSVVTKSELVTRDLDLLAPMARERLASVLVSVTTLDPELARRMEPRASVPARRLVAIRAVAEAGVPVGVLASPMIPGLNDGDLERILEAARDAGAGYAGTILVRLPHEVKTLFAEWLAEHYPERAERVLALIRQCRGGRLNDPRFGSRMRGAGSLADLLRRRFELACRRLGLRRDPEPLDVTRFRLPPVRGEQRTLFTGRAGRRPRPSRYRGRAMFDALERTLRERLAGDLPGHRAHLLMSPRPRYGWKPGYVPPDTRPGAGLVLLYPADGAAHVVLTVRHADLPQHAGQVSLPGGAVEPGESIPAAALREAAEEIGVVPERVRLLGRLSPLHIPISGFALHPVLGLADARPELRPDPREVERVLEVALDSLGDPGRLGRFSREFRGKAYEVPFFRLGRDRLWGATAMVLTELLWMLDVRPDAWAEEVPAGEG